MAGFFRLLTALSLLPACCGVVMSLLDSILASSGASGWISVESMSALGGVAAFSLCWMAVSHPVRAYVLGHELTHALAAMLCFGKVQALSVDVDGGYVDTDTDNLFVSLAPYFVPLWMLLWLGVLFVANWIYPFAAYLPWFYAGFGFWWAFHVYWTLWVIPREQPDLLENGVVLSFMIIMLTNVVALLLMLRCFGVLSFHGYAQDFVVAAREIAAAFADLWQLLCALAGLV